MKKFLWVFVIAILTGCVSKAEGVEKESVEALQLKIEKLSQDLKQTNRDKQNLVNQIEKLSDEIRRLENDNDLLMKEKELFLQADQVGRELYHSMVDGDTEKLNEMVAADLKVFAERFETKIDDVDIKLPFHHLQTISHKTNGVIVKNNGFSFDSEKQLMWIGYMMIDKENRAISFLKVLIQKVDDVNWIIQNVEFDI